MGQKLLDMYDEAKKIGGLNAQIKLAILTSAPSTKASQLPDSPENIEKFIKAMEVVRREFS
ncbi:MAG: hypothetical protein ACM3KR_10560 [Deltaproteobacteria bacterium]